MKRLMIILFMIASLMISVACNLSMPVQPTPLSNEEIVALAVLTLEAKMTAEAPKSGVQPSVTPAGGNTVTQVESSAATPRPTNTPQPSPTITLTPTSSNPIISVNVNTNCRSGPGPDYDIIGQLLVGEEAVVIALGENPYFILIENPDSPGTCWLWLQHAEITGDTSTLPIATPPPTTAQELPDWTGTWSSWHEEITDVYHPVFEITINHAGDQISGSYSIGGENYNFVANLNEDYTHADGNWVHESDFSTGFIFWWLMENGDQFYGSTGGNWGAWCGARNGLPKPDPCGNYE